MPKCWVCGKVTDLSWMRSRRKASEGQKIELGFGDGNYSMGNSLFHGGIGGET